MTFIEAHKDRFGVQPICRVLSEHGWRIASSTYRAFRARPGSARTRRDAQLAEQIKRVHAANYGVYAWATIPGRHRGSAAGQRFAPSGSDQLARVSGPVLPASL